MGKFLFNEVFREIIDSYHIDSTILGKMTDRDASRIRHYKKDSKPGMFLLEQLINSICKIIAETNDSYINTTLIIKLNQMVNQNVVFPDDVRLKLIETTDIQNYIPFLLRRSLELSNVPLVSSPEPAPSLDSSGIITKVTQAHHYFENNLYQDAVTLYEEILNSPKLSELLAQQQLVHTDLGLIYRNSGLNQYDIETINLSLQHFQKAAKIALQAEDQLGYAVINKYLGTVYMSLSNLDDAEVNIKEAIKYYDLALSSLIDKDPEEYHRVMINFGNLFIHYANIRNSRKFLKNAISYLDKALVYYKDSNNYFEGLIYLHNSSAYSMLAEISNSKDNGRQAIQMIQNALKIFTIEDYPSFYAQCISNLAHIHLMMAEYDNTIDNCNIAIGHINHALDIFAENIDTYSYFIAHLNLTAVYILLSNATKNSAYLEKAMDCIQKCQIHQVLEDSSLNSIKTNLSHAEVMINFAEAKKDLTKLDEVETMLNSCLQLGKKLKYDYIIAITESLIAKLNFTRYDITDDLSFLDEVLLHSRISLNIFNIQDYPLYHANILHMVAKAYRSKGDHEKSKHNYEIILNVFTKEKYTEKNSMLTEEYYDLCKEKGWQIIVKLK